MTRTSLFPELSTRFDIAGTMMIIALIGCLSLAVVISIVPETRRCTVEQFEITG